MSAWANVVAKSVASAANRHHLADESTTGVLGRFSAYSSCSLIIKNHHHCFAWGILLHREIISNRAAALWHRSHDILKLYPIAGWAELTLSLAALQCFAENDIASTCEALSLVK